MGPGNPVQAMRPKKRMVIPSQCHLYVPCNIKASFGSQFCVYPSPDTIVASGGLVVTPSVNQLKDVRGLADVSILNFTDEDITISKCDTIGFMEILGKEDLIEYIQDEEKGGATLRTDRPPEAEIYRCQGFERDIKSHPPEKQGEVINHISGKGHKQQGEGGVSHFFPQLMTPQKCGQTSEER